MIKPISFDGGHKNVKYITSVHCTACFAFHSALELLSKPRARAERCDQ